MGRDESPSVITDPEVLHEAHVPRSVLGRETLLREAERVLGVCARRHKPVHCWVHGEPGTGKTAAARWLVRKLRMEQGVAGLYVNCWEYPSYFAVLDRIVRELRILGAERLTVSFKLERLKRHLGSDPLVIVLDEIDRPPPRERNSILYNLSQIGNVGLVCLSNSEHVFFGLEERVRSRLNPVRITFRPYTDADLFEILKQRAFDALNLDAWYEDDLMRIAQLSGGDARLAIQTLRNAAMLAEVEGAEVIGPGHVEAGWNSASQVKKSYLLGKLTDHHRLLYEIIGDNPGIRSGQLWKVYLKTCRERGMKPIAVRTYSDYCNALGRQGLVEIKRAAVSGKVREFWPAA